MKIAKGVDTIDLTMNMGEHAMQIHPTLVWDDQDVVLIDTGVPGQLAAIQAEMKKAGVPFERLNKIIITHQDFDHIGSLPEILAAADHPIEVYAHRVDKPYIEGDKPLIKFDADQMLKRFESLPEAEREKATKLFGKAPQAPVNTTLEDNEELSFCGGITVIYTPGHTPGHISLYLNESKTLITGDAFVSNDGKMLGPNVAVTPDMAAAVDSLKKFLNFDIEQVVCYHGGLCKENVRGQLEEIANKTY
ncbi:glyoxylase-like metal-dependent hydrolase (beta-lactamase superfamily II) [Pullulanibacillus pueri]|uniref:Hydrolase n=1 Tax=Pullulanibacillus pueri TaxID=1437324 RepID=A0A8J3EM22_9BACL|nr:MBL fold metallo-hydrolase [Pullulanibacillus pueri]MBM7681405.1 glyoxylase-like metal-dependent hydrolase (beta-lactamase superfamily II) [Pullulanibacillus pueri]GGH78750.1 hydrolase [Pullulanibacillus pueri]